MHEKDLAEMFTKFGDIVNIIYKGCYAFIEFAEVDCAEECVREMSKEKESDLQVQMAFNRSIGGLTMPNARDRKEGGAPQ
jgi:hypothetical protein